MRNIAKKVSIVLGTIILLLIIVGLIIHRPLPQGTPGAEAEALADSVLKAVNYAGYDTLEEIRWTYPRGHEYIWNKKEHKVKVRWDTYDVDLKPDSLDGTAYKNTELLSGNEKEHAIRKAWELFANDSFWLVAPFKIRDTGTKRSIVKTERGDALLVTYTTGGVTPGDSYLWFLDENYRPVAWQVWVKIIPVGGLEFTWESWQKQESIWFALDHQGPGPVHIRLSNLQVNSL